MNKSDNVLLKIKGLNHSYGEEEILNDLSLPTYFGEIVCILGYSGSGKTTLLNIISRLLIPNSGSIYLDNKPLSDIPPDILRTKYIGIIFQGFDLFGHMNALDNVISSSWYLNQNYNENKQLAINILGQMDMKRHMYKKPGELSGGQKQRVGIARAIINNPKIIIADEPTSNLDTDTSIEIMKILRNLTNEERGMIFSTHNLRMAMFADRIMILKNGKLERISKDALNEKNNLLLLYEDD